MLEQSDMELDFEERMVSPEAMPSDDDIDYSLRPKTLNEYIGQDKVKENIVLIFNDVKAKRYFAPNLMKQNLLYISFLGCVMG